MAVNDVQDNDVLVHTLHNIDPSEKKEVWVIRCGSKCVNEYACLDTDGVWSDSAGENPNHLLGSFPCLFPYSYRGFEVDRLLVVSYEAHTQWCL